MKSLKRDLILSLICGEITSWFLILVIKNPYVKEFGGLAKMESLIWALPIVLPIIFVAGTLIGRAFSRLFEVISQIVKFLEIGVLNTFIDLGILNFLVGLSGVTFGLGLVPLNTFSFLCAATNSYYWNKFWTFSASAFAKASADRQGYGGQGKRGVFLQFLLISVIGWGINTSIVVLGTTFMLPLASLSAGAWINVVKLTATFISMVWNFLGYKFIVFKK